MSNWFYDLKSPLNNDPQIGTQLLIIGFEYERTHEGTKAKSKLKSILSIAREDYEPNNWSMIEPLKRGHSEEYEHSYVHSKVLGLVFLSKSLFFLKLDLSLIRQPLNAHNVVKLLVKFCATIWTEWVLSWSNQETTLARISWTLAWNRRLSIKNRLQCLTFLHSSRTDWGDKFHWQPEVHHSLVNKAVKRAMELWILTAELDP